AFEFLCERYVEAHSRRLSVTRDDVAALMHRLAVHDGGTVLDPACGVGTLLLQAGNALGQEINETNALLTAVRLLLRGARTRIVAGDSLREDGLSDELADAVVCDPPFNERAWGYEELTGDPRWEYGLPPRGESELAWVQHCLARARVAHLDTGVQAHDVRGRGDAALPHDRHLCSVLFHHRPRSVEGGAGAGVGGRGPAEQARDDEHHGGRGVRQLDHRLMAPRRGGDAGEAPGAARRVLRRPGDRIVSRRG
ncbi:class I SAM-dependent DNA methyltransferase, partial [Streptosporangium algeriense]